MDSMKLSIFQGGQTLIELLVTLGIATIFIVTLISVSTGALGNINFSKTQSDGNRYAREALEWIRAQRDADWTMFSGKASVGGTTWCLSTLAWPGSSGSCGSTKIPSTIFTRETTLTTVSASKINVTINVTWTDGHGGHNAQVNSTFTNWKNSSIFIPPTSVPAPTQSPTIYALPAEYSGNQGPIWYYYAYFGGTFALTYDTNSVGPATWANPKWYAPGGGYTYISSGVITGDDDAIIYWKAPSAGSAQMVVTEQKGQTGGNGFDSYVGSGDAVGAYPGATADSENVSGNDNSQKTLDTGAIAVSSGSVLFYRVNAKNSPFHDDANYTIQVTLTPN